jgi:hypothetical protein
MISKPNENKIIAVLMKQYGRMFSSELGIKMENAPSAVFHGFALRYYSA